MNALSRTLSTAMLVAAVSTTQGATTTKDIVLDRVSSPWVTTVNVPVQNAVVVGDAMAVSVLLERPDGTLIPKSTNSIFRTGDRFRVKLLASRDSRVSLYNTNPKGEMNPKPVWHGQVKSGLETISSRLALTGNSGVDQLHVVMEPVKESGIVTWLSNWLRSAQAGGSSSKDIQLDVQNTPQTTYLLNANGQGLVSTVQIVHAPR